ncbi:multiple inositol polyphosphate phosphatase 1-like, partial [Sceloporus undulatus]|uniref:multiple inositol polyphosphate phosphatase 1-like n=1 Tax=Sceloporus undulatus TaxID=8520 RepID=UPI001C4BD095
MRPLCAFSVPLLLLLMAGVPASAETAAQLSPYFGTKSRYEELNRYLLEDPYSPGPSLTGFPLPASSCVPLQLTAVLRHGTRFPTRKQVEKLARLHGRVVQRSKARPPCPDAQRLARWPLWPRPEVDGKLAARGRRDMEALARRLASRLPSLLGPSRRFAFLSSSKPRCLDSAAAFREGLRVALFGSADKD